jgi:hypothetical protein
MHRYDLLEKEYYKRKIIKFFLLGLVGVLGILGLIFSISTNKKKKLKIDDLNIDVNTTVNLVEINKSKFDINKSEFETNKKEFEKEPIKEIFLLPEVNFSKSDLQKLLSSDSAKVRKLSFLMPKEYLPFKFFIMYKLSKLEENKTKTKEKVIKPKKEVIITPKYPLIKEEKIDDKYLLNKFNSSPTFDNAILLSTYYFNKNNLQKAKEWALKANSINSENYQSWEMFAKILLRKNQKEKAKRVLKAYIQNYGYNENIENLLRSIE